MLYVCAVISLPSRATDAWAANLYCSPSRCPGMCRQPVSVPAAVLSAELSAASPVQGRSVSSPPQQPAALLGTEQPGLELGPFLHRCRTVYIDEAEPERPARDGSATASSSGSSSRPVMSDDEAWAQVRLSSSPSCSVLLQCSRGTAAGQATSCGLVTHTAAKQPCTASLGAHQLQLCC